MKIGVNNMIWVSPFKNENLNLIKQAKDMGFDIFELAIEDMDLDIPLIRSEILKNSLEITVCGAFGLTRDISNMDADIRINGKEYLEYCIKKTEELGATLFCGPVYSAVGKTRRVPEEQKKREWDYCVENMREIAQIARECGVKIGIEPLNRFESDMITTVDQAIDLMNAVNEHDVYGVHIDMFHSNIEEKSIPACIRKLGKERLFHIHACENDRGTPGTGHQEWKEIIKACKEIDYEGGLVIESFTPDCVELAAAAAIWRPWAESQELLAFEGQKFLRSLL